MSMAAGEVYMVRQALKAAAASCQKKAICSYNRVRHRDALMS